MKLLYVLLNRNNEILLYKTSTTFSIPFSGAEVDTSYGFDTPETDNRWFLLNCGLHVFRRYVFFCDNYCISVFELYTTVKLEEDFLWVNYDEINKYIKNQEELSILKNVIKNYNYSKNVPWVNTNGFRPYLEWVQAVAEQNNFAITGDIIQIKNAYVSTLFMIPTSIGWLFLKIPTTIYLNDIENIENFLVNEIFGIPNIIAISPNNDAFLAKDMLGDNLSNVDNMEMLKQIVKQWAIIQQSLTSNNKSFAKIIPLLHDYSPKGILSRLENFPSELTIVFNNINKPFTQEMYLRVNDKLCEVRKLLQLLMEYNLPNTLCHGDLRPGNIRVINGAYALYDWGMSIYAHPFYDVLHFLHVIRRQLPSEAKDKILKTYLLQWKTVAPSINLNEVFEIMEQLRDFFMTYADCEWLLEIIKASDHKIAECSIDDWLFSRRAYYFSSVFDKFMSGL